MSSEPVDPAAEPAPLAAVGPVVEPPPAVRRQGTRRQPVVADVVDDVGAAVRASGVRTTRVSR